MSLENFDRFVNIIIQNRLYGSTYKELNDPMEGFYISSNFSKQDYNDILDAKRLVRICSLSKNYDNPLLWTHYADEHKGICLALEVSNSSVWHKIPVNYSSSAPSLNNKMSHHDWINTIFSTKSDYWSYEQEIRYIQECSKTKKNQPKKAYLPIRIKKIYLGIRTPKETQDSIRRLVKIINSNIIIVKLKRDDLSFWSNNNNSKP